MPDTPKPVEQFIMVTDTDGDEVVFRACDLRSMAQTPGTDVMGLNVVVGHEVKALFLKCRLGEFIMALEQAGIGHVNTVDFN